VRQPRDPKWSNDIDGHQGGYDGARASQLYRVILTGVKTAISVPDDTYERAAKRAKDLGMSRSEFFSRAAARYLDQLDSESLTQQIDAAVEALGENDDSAADAVAVGHRILVEIGDDW
jgi:hypothetical protein